MRSKKLMAFGVFDVINTCLLGVLALVTFFPFYSVVVNSFADFNEYMNNAFMLFPKTIHLDAYEFIFQKTNILLGARNTVLITIIGTAYNMLLTTMLAYGLSRRHLLGRVTFINIILFTMFFSGGLIPFYILVVNLHLNNTLFAMILPVGVNTFYLIVIKNYFSNLPIEFEEAPKVDGANDLQIFFSIILPVSKPVIMSFVLFYAVDRWNEWWNAMLFVRDSKLHTMQLILRDIVINLSQSDTMAYSAMRKPPFPLSIKAAAIVLTSFPIMCLYPFVQKYFVKGITIGAIKS